MLVKAEFQPILQSFKFIFWDRKNYNFYVDKNLSYKNRGVNMKGKSKLFIIIVLILVFATALVACDNTPDDNIIPGDIDDKPIIADKTVTETKLTIYDAPELIESSKVASVSVEGKDLFVYDTRVNHLRSFTYSAPETYNQVVIFDFEGKVHIEIEINGQDSLSDVIVRPLSYGITANTDGNKISFDLEYPSNYVVEYATKDSPVASENALHIFANPIESEEAKVTEEDADENTIYIGPGVWMASAIPVDHDNMTVYIAGGAVVYGQIRAKGLKNLTIKGRGVISGSFYDRNKASEYTLPIELQECENVHIEGISILDPAGWAITVMKCADVTIDNIKIITARANGDGISVQSSSNVNVNGGFVRTWDDSLVVKNVENCSTSDISFNGVTVWTDLAQSMEVGYETYGPSMKGVTFENITILHNFHKAAISLHNADNAVIEDVTYRNITIEDGQMKGDNQNDGENDFLIDMTIAYNQEWTESGGERGSVKNIIIDNVKVLTLADTIICRMFGEGENSKIQNVTITNVTINGKNVDSLSDMGLNPGVYTEKITYASAGTASGAKRILPYTLSLKDGDEPVINEVKNIHQTGLQVPSFGLLSNEPPYSGQKADLSTATIGATYGAGEKVSSPWNNGPVQDLADYPLSNLVDGDRSSEWRFSDWKGDTNEFIAVSFEFESARKIGKIRFMGSTASDILYYYNISIFSKTDGGEWKRLAVQQDITISPLESNYADLIIRSNIDYEGLQLRFFKKEGVAYPDEITLGEIEFYPPSLTTNKSFKEVAEHEDVYDISNMIDGNTSTYFESKKGVFPAEFAIDLGDVYNVKYVNLHVPPVLLWEKRTQEIEILGSLDGVTYEVVKVSTEYVFDPMTGNTVSIVLDEAVAMRYFKLVYNSNSSGYGAQISELYVYGE